MIKVTISANESLSAWEPVKIASILAFSVSILLSNPVSIATLWVWAEPLKEDIPDVLLEITDAKAFLIASLLTSAELLNAVMLEALVEMLPATVLYPDVPVISIWPDPDTNAGLLVMSSKSVEIDPIDDANEALTADNSASVA